MYGHGGAVDYFTDQELLDLRLATEILLGDYDDEYRDEFLRMCGPGGARRNRILHVANKIDRLWRESAFSHPPKGKYLHYSFSDEPPE